jgi:VWFA-related protein
MTRFPACLSLLSVSLCVAQICAAQTPTAVPTLKAKTRIVVIDVVVTDKQGKPVKDLQATDFALAENGAPQTIKHFEVHTSLSAEDATKLAAMPKMEQNIFTNYSPVPVNGPLTVLVFDALNTKMSDQSIVLKQMLKYLDTPHPGVRMELFELNSGLRLVQGFTSDPEVLRAALVSRKAAPQASAQMDKPDEDEATQITRHDLIAPATQLITNIMNSTGPGQDLNFNRGGAAGFQLWQRQTTTLDAMAALARYLGTLPGRKNLLWFSASFAIPKSWPDVAQKLHETMALLANSQVAVYPIGAYGLRPDLNTMWSPTGLLKKTDAEYTTMDMMAEDTGGKVFMNSNDIAGAADQAIDDGSNYYTLTYTPANRDWKGEFRKVQVKLAQEGYTLAYRPGYYAEDLDKRDHKDAERVLATPDPARTALHAAMEYGSPQPSDIVLKVAVNPATGHPEKVVAKANMLAPNVSGPFERYVLSVAALPTAFTFTRDVPGKIHMSARLVTCVYSTDGALINSTALNAIGDIDDARYQSIMADGVQFRQEVSVPVEGESFLRIGVEDLATNRMGVVEIPVATVKKLKPLAGQTVSQK